MAKPEAEKFHHLLGPNVARIAYKAEDFLDYLLMLVVTALLANTVYGSTHPLAQLSSLLCLIMVIVFPLRHGFKWTVPTFLRHPQEMVYAFYYKIANIKYPLLLAIALLGLENLLIRQTPSLPHHTELMGTAALTLFYLHLGGITLYRSYILWVHLKHHRLVRDVLKDTAYRRFVNTPASTVLEILHGYFTGLLTHIILLTPWYLVIDHVQFSVLLFPLTFVLCFIIETRFMLLLNPWFYRDHWLGHHSETEFLYLHGSHHDALPSALMAVSGNGFLEGCTRYLVGFPHAYYNPALAFLLKTFTVVSDMNSHQYIPGLFPKIPLPAEMRIHSHHACHHFGKLEPYGLGSYINEAFQNSDPVRKRSKYEEILANSITLDEALNGYDRNNPAYQKYLELVNKYQS